MQQTSNRQSGFAIGTILLAVVLIAAIVSAIAIASRGSQSQGNREQARVNASTVVSQGINLRNGFERLVGGGAQIATITASDAATIANTNLDAAGNCTTPTVDRGAAGVFECLYGEGGATAQTAPRAAFTTSTGAQKTFTDNRYFFSRNVTGFNGGRTTAIMYMSDVSRIVCQQLNNIVNGASLNANPPAAGALRNITVDATRVDEATAFPIVLAAPADTWQEGCIRIFGANEDDTSVYMYIKGLNG